MVLQATIDMLVGMKMTAMAAELSSQLQDSSFCIYRTESPVCTEY